MTCLLVDVEATVLVASMILDGKRGNHGGAEVTEEIEEKYPPDDFRRVFFISK